MRRGELQPYTVILVVVGLIFLFVGIFFLTNGFNRIDFNNDPLLDSYAGAQMKSECNMACKASNFQTYCCKNFTAVGEFFRCNNPRLKMNCTIVCSGVNC